METPSTSKVEEVKLTDEMDRCFYQEAVEMAERGLAAFEVPVGCVFVYNNEIIGRGHNEVNKRFNSTYHAEIVAIDQIYQWCQKHGHDYREIFPECTLYVNLEPCCMCSSGLYQLRIKKVIFGAPNDRFGGMGSVMSNADFKHPHEIEIVPNVDVIRPVEMLKRFYQQSNPFAPTEKRKTRNKIAVDEAVVNALND